MNKDTLLYSKTRNVKSPARAHLTDAGIDFFLPDEFTEEDIKHSCDVTGTTLFFDYKDNLNPDIVKWN
jgi:hypothetical protein